MPSGREQIRRALSHPREKPVRALGRSILFGLPIAVLVGFVQVFTGFFESASPAAILLIGISVSMLLWGADRLWFSMIAPMFQSPFSLPAYISRLPFWYVAGGIAFETAVLASKSLGWLATYGIAVKFDFDMGARIGVVSACLLHGVLYRSVQQTLRGTDSPGKATTTLERP